MIKGEGEVVLIESKVKGIAINIKELTGMMKREPLHCPFKYQWAHFTIYQGGRSDVSNPAASSTLTRATYTVFRSTYSILPGPFKHVFGYIKERLRARLILLISTVRVLSSLGIANVGV